MSGTVSTPVEVPRETIEATFRQMRWQTGFPPNIPDATDAAIRRATEIGMLKLVEPEVDGCSQTKE